MNISNEKSKNAVIYCRVSSEEQAKEGESLSAQERRCKAYCESKNWSVIRVFIEAGESGRTDDRTQLKKLLAFCFERANMVSSVVCLKQDRFSRNLLDFRRLEGAFSARNISLIFVEGNNERNAQGNLIRNISGSFAEFESDINSERTKAGLAEAVLNGRWVARLFGYTFKQNEFGKRQLYPDANAEIVRRIFTLAHEGIYKQSEIIERMKRGGFQVSKQRLSYILHNSVYCGWLPDKYFQNGGALIKGIHEPLIPEKMFYEVQAILSGRMRTAMPRRRNNPEFPLRRFVICSNCGKTLTACYSKGRNMRVGYYQCPTKGCPRYQKKVLEPAFKQYLSNIKPTEKALQFFEEEVIAEFNRLLSEENMLRKKATHEVCALKKQKKKIIELMIRGSVPEHDGKVLLEKINDDIQSKCLNAGDEEQKFDVNDYWTEAKNFISNLDVMWENGDLNLKQRVQGLITPKGFVFKNNLIEPLESPYFIRIFNQNCTLCQNTLLGLDSNQQPTG